MSPQCVCVCGGGGKGEGRKRGEGYSICKVLFLITIFLLG